MTDELRGRMRELARQAEQVPVRGLADVRHRRARRQRNTALGTGLAVVAIVAAVTFLLPPFGEGTSIQPIGPGGTVTITRPPGSTSPDPAGSTGGGSPPSEESPSPPVQTIDFGSLVSAAELEAAGVPTVGPDLGDLDGQPTLPGLCTGPTWQEQYSQPSDRVSGGYPIDGGQVLVDLLAYDGDVAANAALVKLKEDARACPVVNEFLSVSVTAVGSAIGAEFVVFALDAESGQDGSVERILVTVARVGNVLVEAALDRDFGYAGDVSGDEQLSRSSAQANVDHLLTG